VIRVPGRADVLGADHHRSGWTYALQCLAPLESEGGLLVEDFVDRRFGWEPRDRPITEPWVGVFHKPPRWPEWLGVPGTPNTPLRVVESRLFRESLPHLRLAVVMSEYLAAWVAEKLPVRVGVVRHPTAPAQGFSMAAYRANPTPRLVQVGYVLRNTDAIYQLRPPPGVTKTHLRVANAGSDRTEAQVSEYWRRTGTRAPAGEVQRLSRLTNGEYDRLLSENVVFLELFDSSVNNTVVECLARNTPLVVNRLPALEEYLGTDYPLFYDDFLRAADLVSDRHVEAAHEYLKARDKRWLGGDVFANDVGRLVESVL